MSVATMNLTLFMFLLVIEGRRDEEDKGIYHYRLFYSGGDPAIMSQIPTVHWNPSFEFLPVFWACHSNGSQETESTNSCQLYFSSPYFSVAVNIPVFCSFGEKIAWLFLVL